MLNYIRTTTASTGLKVRASLTRGHYLRGVRITDAQMATLKLHAHSVLAKWNYAILPAAG